MASPSVSPILCKLWFDQPNSCSFIWSGVETLRSILDWCSCASIPLKSRPKASHRLLQLLLPILDPSHVSSTSPCHPLPIIGPAACYQVQLGLNAYVTAKVREAEREFQKKSKSKVDPFAAFFLIQSIALHRHGSGFNLCPGLVLFISNRPFQRSHQLESSSRLVSSVSSSCPHHSHSTEFS